MKILHKWRFLPKTKMVLSMFPAVRPEVGDGRAAEERTIQALFLYISVEDNLLLAASHPPVTRGT